MSCLEGTEIIEKGYNLYFQIISKETSLLSTCSNCLPAIFKSQCHPSQKIDNHTEHQRNIKSIIIHLLPRQTQATEIHRNQIYLINN